jgi:hypothetical protein
MACVPGKCPCWPQAEPFDDAEMDLLATVQKLMRSVLFCSTQFLWEEVVTHSLAVRPRRLGYVLSTFVNGRTLLGRMSEDAARVCWLLHSGICPNIAWTLGIFGWAGGRRHPGRPAQPDLVSPLIHTRSRHVFGGLLSAGAYPVYSCSFGGQWLTTLTRQWLAWHARASRRTWTALAMALWSSSLSVS